VAGPTRFDNIIHHAWRRVRVGTSRSERILEARRYRYAMLDGADARQFAHAQLSTVPGVVCLEGHVERIVDGHDAATVVLADGRTVTGRWVFDSRPRPAALASCLWQAFEGWEIETPGCAFDTGAPTLMDFRTPQANMLRFVYVVPLSAQRALVEHVACGVGRPSPLEQQTALTAYLIDRLGIGAYRIVRRERGVSPLTTGSCPRQVGSRVMTIGIPGGRIKPSTGYAFTRIQRDSAAIVQSLLHHGHPFGIAPDSPRHRRYDAALLAVLHAQPERLEAMFDRLFACNPLDRVFRFLDEATTLFEEVQLAATLPAWFWLRALAPAPTERNNPCVSPRLSL
jgi:lycopene beta-cyclase